MSGHPSQDELRQMYKLLRPKMVIPVHGEFKHLEEHAKLALKCNVPETLIVSNGDVVHLNARGSWRLGKRSWVWVERQPSSCTHPSSSPQRPSAAKVKTVSRVTSGYLVLDGNQLRPLASEAVKKREVWFGFGLGRGERCFANSVDLLSCRCS